MDCIQLENALSVIRHDCVCFVVQRCILVNIRPQLVYLAGSQGAVMAAPSLGILPIVALSLN